jgi:hypothetical protein
MLAGVMACCVASQDNYVTHQDSLIYYMFWCGVYDLD